MLRQTITQIAVLSVFLAIIAWGGVGYLVWNTMKGIADKSDLSNVSKSSFAQRTIDAHIHALAVSTATDRTQLNELFNTDIVSIVNIIETAGSSVGAPTQITDASQAKSANGSPVRATVFSTQSTGSFASLMRAAKLLETLPIPSSVEQIDLIRTGEGATPQWHMNARIRVLTTSNISS